MRRRLRVPGVLLCAAVMCGCGTSKDNPRVVVLAAASLAGPLDSVIARFGHETDAEVHVAYGASGTLAQQIRSGVDAQLYLTADYDWIERLQRTDSNLIATAWPFLSNRLVIVTRKGSGISVDGLADLTKTWIRRIAIADPEAAPAGRYARAALTSAGLYEALMPKLAPAENVTAAATVVRLSVADVGLVYHTNAVAFDELDVIHSVDPSLHPQITYGVAVLGDSGHVPNAAFRLARFLRSPYAAAVFAQSGFEALAETLHTEGDR